MAWLRLPFGALGRGTLVVTVGLWSRALLQGLYLVLVSRWLEASGYGLFSGSASAIVLFAPLANLGMGFVFTDYAARRNISLSVLWSQVLRLSWLSTILIALVVVILAVLVLPVRLGPFAMALIAVSELIAVPLIAVASAALMTKGRAGSAAAAVGLVPAVRCAGILALMAMGAAASVQLLVVVHCLGSACVAIWALRVTRSTLLAENDLSLSGKLPSGGRLLKDGFYYALGNTMGISYSEVDKVFMLQALGAETTGNYTVAFRVVAVLALPISALLSSATPRLFAEHHTGAGRRVLKAVVASGLCYALVASAMVLLLAPVMPIVFGMSYTTSSHLATLLSAWLPLSVLHVCGSIALVTSGRKALRLTVESVGMGLIIFLNVLLLPSLGVEGAITAVLSGECLMGAGCWFAYFACRNDQAEQTK